MNDNLSGLWLITFLLTLLYCMSTAFSIVLLGGKFLESNNLYKIGNLIGLITNWRFILSMGLAILSRLSFILINSTILKIPYLAGTATTVSVFITILSIVFILFINHVFLKETLNLKQAIGAVIVLTGVFIMLSK